MLELLPSVLQQTLSILAYHVLPLHCQRNRQTVRDRSALMHNRLAHAGLFWWQQGRGDTVYSAQNSNGLLFFEVCSLLWTGALQVA